MADKYVQYLEQLPYDIVHIAESFAKDNKCPQVEPAHLLRALLHKSAGLMSFIENQPGGDYYYMVDWADIRMQQCEHSPYGMKRFILSPEAKQAVKEAVGISERSGQPVLTSESLLAALLTPGIAFTYEQLKTMPLTAEQIVSAMTAAPASRGVKAQAVLTPSATAQLGSPEGLTDYCTAMLSREGRPELIGFADEVNAMAEVLARKDRANLLIVGDTGVGKTSLVQHFVGQIAEKMMPTSLSALQPYELDLISLSQGVSYKGEIEDRFKKIIDAMSNLTQPLLVIENFHRVEDKQSVLSGILPIIKKVVQQGTVQLILTATIDGYTKDIEKDRELMAYFEKLSLEEPTSDVAVEILQSKRKTYEEFHRLRLEDDVPVEMVRLAKRYMPERHLPSSAIDLMDRTMASAKIKNERAASESVAPLTKDDVRDAVSKITGIPMGNIQGEERDRLTRAEDILHKRVVGQNHAIRSILDAIYESRSGLNKKGQPMGSFFFLGPTGTGKTELAKSLAEFLFNDETSILRFDMSEYKEEHSVALLYGAPPGYVGYEEGGLLVNQIRQHPYSVVLFDEIEKAHRSVFDLFLQILDEGKLHDRLGRVGDFSNALIIFTSNIGSDYIFKSFGEGRVPTHDQMLDVMQGRFRPEFLARLTEIVPFSPITTEMINRIFDIHVKNLLKTLAEQDITLHIDDKARRYVTSVGFNAHYGARPILSIIRKEIRRPLSKMIIAGDVAAGDIVSMSYDEEKKEIIWEISDEPEQATEVV